MWSIAACVHVLSWTVDCQQELAGRLIVGISCSMGHSRWIVSFWSQLEAVIGWDRMGSMRVQASCLCTAHIIPCRLAPGDEPARTS